MLAQRPAASPSSQIGKARSNVEGESTGRRTKKVLPHQSSKADWWSRPFSSRPGPADYLRGL